LEAEELVSITKKTDATDLRNCGETLQCGYQSTRSARDAGYKGLFSAAYKHYGL